MLFWGNLAGRTRKYKNMLIKPANAGNRFQHLLVVMLALAIFAGGFICWNIRNTRGSGNNLFLLCAAFSGLMLVSVLSSKISGRMNMPCLLLFLGVGMLAGSPKFGDVKLVGDHLKYANYIGSFALAYILFSGGFNTSWESVKKVLVTGAVLSSFGVLLTALFTGAGFWAVMEATNRHCDFPRCLLLGAIVSSTDAAAVFSILRSRGVSLKGNLKPLLEFESGSNDPMAAILTVVLTDIVVNGGYNGPWWRIPLQIILKMAIGGGIGLLIGKFSAWLYNWIDLEYDGLYFVLAVLTALAAFSLPELMYGNGFMGVYAAGLAMGNSRFLLHNSIGKFNDGIGWLMQVLLFTMLGLLVNPGELGSAAIPGLAAVVLLMLVARPLATFICMFRSRFTIPERVLVSWVGLRGGAPIMLATYPLALADSTQNRLLFHLVFFIVLASVLLQGTTIMPLARLLHLDAPVKKTPRAPLEVEETGDDNMLSRELTVGVEADGMTLAELKMPAGALVLMICRADKILLPRGTSRLQTGDVVTVLGTDEALEECRKLITLG